MSAFFSPAATKMSTTPSDRTASSTRSLTACSSVRFGRRPGSAFWSWFRTLTEDHLIRGSPAIVQMVHQ